PGIALSVAGGTAFTMWLMGFPREGLLPVNRALALAGEDVLAGAGMVVENHYANCLLNRGLCRGHLGDLEGARADIDRAIQIARDHGAREDECFCLALRTLIAPRSSSSRRPLDDAEDAVQIAEESGSSLSLLTAYAALASARAAYGHHPGAVEAASRFFALL